MKMLKFFFLMSGVGCAIFGIGSLLGKIPLDMPPWAPIALCVCGALIVLLCAAGSKKT